MGSHFDTYAAALDVERKLALNHAQRRARHAGAVDAGRSTGVGARAEVAAAPSGRLADLVRSLCWVIRPSYA